MLLRQVWILICATFVWAAAEGPRCPPSIAPERCKEDKSALDEYFFYINGQKLTITYKATYLHITCPANVTLESEELPRFRVAVEVPRVKLTACAPPALPYAAALRALNVTPALALELAEVPPAPALAPHHLRGLRAPALTLGGASALAPPAALLGALPDLRDLRLARVELSPAAALRLPPALRALSVRDAALAGGLPGAALARLPALRRLSVRAEALRALDLSGAPALADAAAEAPLEGVALGAALANLSLAGVRRAELRGDCAALRRLVLERAPAPGAGWLAGCAGLQTLAVRRCALAELPPRWLQDAPALRVLDLSDNELQTLPASMVGLARELEELTLSGNRLQRVAVELAAALPRLAALALDRNPLGDLCGAPDAPGDVLGNGQSPLWSARGLRRLSLARTGAARVCRDWRLQLRALAALDLRDNRLPRLEYADLQWRRDAPATVDLRRNPLRAVAYTRADYDAALAAPPAPAPAPAVTLLVDAPLRCDCGDYWYARALRDAPRHAAALQTARCAAAAGGGALAARAPSALLCAAPAAAGCPRGCACAANARSELRCAGGGLRAAPRVPAALPPARALLLPNNSITRISPDIVTPDLEILDLTDNQIEEIDVETASALAAATRLELRLAGNPLRCDCAALPALRLLPPRGGARCRAGEPAPAAAARLAARCAPPLWPLALAAAALCAASAAAAALLARRQARHRVKRFLFERGLCARWLVRAGDEDLAPYDRDVFVSYAQADARAAGALAARLEAGGRRALLHERDWTPGELIPAQIAASVRRARRTVVLLSEHFLASGWARAELREAYGAALRARRPRLLLVLLPGLGAARAAAADPHLRAYIASVTYLRWDDPRFWTRLERALPPPLPAPGPAPAPAAA